MVNSDAGEHATTNEDRAVGAAVAAHILEDLTHRLPGVRPSQIAQVQGRPTRA